MIKKKELVTQEEIESCLSYLSLNNNNGNKSAHEQLLKLLHETRISLDESIIEDSIDSTRIRVSHTITISRKGEGKDEGSIKFQYLKEIPVDYSRVPIRFRETNTTVSNSSATDDIGSNRNNNDAIVEDTMIESYDELQNMIPTLHEILGHLKKIYFMPEDFSNRLVVDRIHRLRNMFSKDEILSFPSIDLSDKAGLIPL
jgi:hypothetical protein